MKKSCRYILCAIVFFVFVSKLAFAKELQYAAPVMLPNVQREMKTAGFWVNRHPYPDRVILTKEKISALNSQIQNELKLTKDIARLPSLMSGKELIVALELLLNEFSKRELYLAGGKSAEKVFYAQMKAGMNLDKIPQEIIPQFGFIVHFADQRFLPTGEGLFSEPGDNEFDELQNSDLDAGEPVAILHTSLDGKWLYTESSLSSGWVEAAKVAIGERADVQRFITKENFAVVIKSKADIFLNPEMTDYDDYVRMGMRFPILSRDDEKVEVMMPKRGQDGALEFVKAFIKRDDVSLGFRDYTPRNVLEQAFELLNAPYGWGGKDGEQDCSRFLQEVFAAIGVFLPRDSKDQAKVGNLLAKFNGKISDEEKLKSLKEKAVGGITILSLKGHIMLFLGMAENSPYAIHATSAYTQKIAGKDVRRVIHRVVVSDLSLSKDTGKKSLLERLNAISILGE